MHPIRYASRVYRPPTDEPDIAGPIATPTYHMDYALVASKDPSGQYLYSRRVPIKVTTARPLEVPAPDGQGAPLRRMTIEVKTRDKSVAHQEVVMSWFPYSFDWESSAPFKGHWNRSKAESQQLLAAVWSEEIPIEDFLRDRKYRDVFETNSSILTAYLPDPKRSDQQIWSQRRHQLRSPWHTGQQKVSELLAFGICDDTNLAVEEIYREEAMLRLFSAVDEDIFYRYWKNHPYCPPRRLRLQLLDNDVLEKVLKSSIRKALAGPIRNQETFLSWPVATWATSVFLAALYNLNRRSGLPAACEPPPSPIANVRESCDPRVKPGFMAEVAAIVQSLSEQSLSTLDYDTLRAAALEQAASSEPDKKTSALALLIAISGYIEIDCAIVELVRGMAEGDADASVRDAAARAGGVLQGRPTGTKQSN